MRKSRSTTRTRLLAAGFTSSAVVAALLGAVPAQAAALDSLSSTIGPTGVTLTATKSSAFTGAAVGALFSETSSCPTAYPATMGAGQTAASSAAKGGTTSTMTIGVPTTLTTGTNGAPKPYYVCTYTGTTAATLTTLVSDTTTYSVIPTVTLAPGGGPAGGSTTVTATAAATTPILTSVTAPGVTFNINACPATYGDASNVPAASVTRTGNASVSAVTPGSLAGTAASTFYNTCIYDGPLSGSSLIGVSVKPFEATLPILTLTPAVGPFAGLNSITATGAVDFLLGVTAPGVLFTTGTACPTTWPASGTTYAAGPPIVNAVIKSANPGRKVSNSRLAVTVPAVPLVNGLPTPYLTCVYNGTVNATSTVVATAPYLSTIVRTGSR
jgi:hypothetical protein